MANKKSRRLPFDGGKITSVQKSKNRSCQCGLSLKTVRDLRELATIFFRSRNDFQRLDRFVNPTLPIPNRHQSKENHILSGFDSEASRSMPLKKRLTTLKFLGERIIYRLCLSEKPFVF
jgi:hypothetical protein